MRSSKKSAMSDGAGRSGGPRGDTLLNNKAQYAPPNSGVLGRVLCFAAFQKGRRVTAPTGRHGWLPRRPPPPGGSSVPRAAAPRGPG